MTHSSTQMIDRHIDDTLKRVEAAMLCFLHSNNGGEFYPTDMSHVIDIPKAGTRGRLRGAVQNLLCEKQAIDMLIEEGRVFYNWYVNGYGADREVWINALTATPAQDKKFESIIGNWPDDDE